MMEPNKDKKPEKKSVRFIEGKGFYIALVLCAAVIGVSAWSLLAGTKTMDDGRDQNAVLEVTPAPTIPVPATPVPTPEMTPEPEIPAEDAAATAAQDKYVWPVDGAVLRPYAMTALAYDETMSDWRTHDGIDIEAKYGTVVSAMASGTVTKVYYDDLYGTTVVTEREDGLRCMYANLESIPTVNVGDQVSVGDTIGSVGDSAGCESAQESHLHLSVAASGQSVSPKAMVSAAGMLKCCASDSSALPLSASAALSSRLLRKDDVTRISGNAAAISDRAVSRSAMSRKQSCTFCTG